MSTPEDDAIMGPVDIVVIGYPPDAPQTGEAIPLFIDLVDRGIIRVLDVRGLRREADGFTAFDVDMVDEIADLQHFSGAQSGLIGESDLAMAAEAMEPGAAAVMIVFENTWAAPFASAVMRNGGELLAFERVTVEDLADAVAALED